MADGKSKRGFASPNYDKATADEARRRGGEKSRGGGRKSRNHDE